MAKVTGGDKIGPYMESITVHLAKAQTVSIGFLEGATYPDGTSVALVAAINEFGAPSRGQPPRPFFRRMIVDKSPEWPGAIAGLLKANDYDAEKTLGLAGMGIKGQLQQSITELTSPPLKPSTIEKKGFSKPLIDTGHMLNSVDFFVT